MSERTDIARLLYTVFDGAPPEGVLRADVVRLWSLEMQWFSPDEAERVVDALGERGWLSQDEGRLNLAPGVELVIPGLGWRPIIRRMLEPPACEASPVIRAETKPSSPPQPLNTFSQPKIAQRQPSTSPEPRKAEQFARPVVRSGSTAASEHTTRQVHPADRAEGSIPVLIDLIARESGLENKEVVRRAQRKRRALGPVTLWMALALVAREQGLDMQRVSSAIERAAQ